MSCSSYKQSLNKIPEFKDIYKELNAINEPELERLEQGEKVSLSVEKMPLVSFVRYVADQASVSVVVASRLDNKEVSLEVKNVEVGALLALVARRLGVELTYSGGVYYIGELRNEDRGVYVRRVKRLDKDGLKQAVDVLLSTNGRATTYEDGLVVVGDRVEVLHRVSELLDQVESAGAESWIIQLYLISTHEKDLSSFGLDVTPTLDVAATFAAASGAGSTRKYDLKAGLFSMLTAEKTNENVELLSAPMFVVVDGGNSVISDGDQLRIPKKTVSDQGTVSTIGFEVVQTGLNVIVGIRDLGSKRAKLDLDAQISEVVGYTEGLPQINKQEFKTTSVIKSAGVYLLGSLQRTNIDDIESWWGLSKENIRTNKTVHIWARAYRVSGFIEGKQQEKRIKKSRFNAP